MNTHWELTNLEFEQAFGDCVLEPSLFNHEAHIRLAWIHISQYGVEQAISNIRRQIRKFAKHHGDENKYHETITVAAILAVYHFILKSSSGKFSDFIQEFPQLVEKFKDLLSSHYSMDIFSSRTARKKFLLPDLEPFDNIG